MNGAVLPSSIRLYDVHRERFKQPGLEAEITNEWSFSTLPNTPL